MPSVRMGGASIRWPDSSRHCGPRPAAESAVGVRRGWSPASPQEQAGGEPEDEAADVREIRDATRLLGDGDLTEAVHELEHGPDADREERRHRKRDEREDENRHPVAREQ